MERCLSLFLSLLDSSVWIFLEEWWTYPFSPLIVCDCFSSRGTALGAPWHLLSVCCCCLVAQSCPTLCDTIDCSPPGSSVHRFPIASLGNHLFQCSCLMNPELLTSFYFWRPTSYKLEDNLFLDNSKSLKVPLYASFWTMGSTYPTLT